MDLDFDSVNRILVEGTWFRGDLVGSASAMKKSIVLSSTPCSGSKSGNEVSAKTEQERREASGKIK